LKDETSIDLRTFAGGADGLRRAIRAWRVALRRVWRHRKIVRQVDSRRADHTWRAGYRDDYGDQRKGCSRPNSIPLFLSQSAY